ncbi:hypothetical protein QQ045_032869 [Rhodiola kirilowii]
MGVELRLSPLFWAPYISTLYLFFQFPKAASSAHNRFYLNSYGTADRIVVGIGSVGKRPMRDIVSNQELAAGLMELIPPGDRGILQDIHMSEYPNKLHWKGAASGILTVKNVLLARRTAGPHKLIFKNIWQTWIPPKISVFIWKFFHKVTPTDDAVISLGIPIALKCVCCESPQVESADHMFLSSDVAAPLWRFLASVFGKNAPRSRQRCPNLKIRRGVWLKWLPHPSGFTMNVASHYGQCGVIIRDNHGNFSFGAMIPLVEDCFLLAVATSMQLISQHQVTIDAIHCSSPDVSLLNSQVFSGRWDSFDRWRSARAQLGPTPVFKIRLEVNLAARILAYHKGQHLCTFNAFSELPRVVQRAVVGDLQNLPVFYSST